MKVDKTIWIINQYAGSPLHGMEFRHYYLSKELVAKGYNVYIISGSYSHLFTKLPHVTGDVTTEVIDKINYCWVKIPSYKKSNGLKRIFNMIVFAYKLGRATELNIPRPRSIIISSPSLFPIVRANKWAKRFKAKLIFEVRDIWPLTLQELGRMSSYNPLIMLMQWFENYGYKSCKNVISLLPGAKGHMMKHGMEESKFICIPNGVDLDEYKNKEPLAPACLASIMPGKFIVGYAGTVGRANALMYLIEAARLLKDNPGIHFIIVGNGSEKENLRKKAVDLTNVTFLNPVSKRSMGELLSKFDACYIGWRKERLYQFGISANKLFDYMYSARPIIHSVESYNDPVAEAGCGISVAPEDPSEIVRAINIISSMPRYEQEIMGNKGKTFVERNHSYKVLAEKLISVV